VSVWTTSCGLRAVSELASRSVDLLEVVSARLKRPRRRTSRVTSTRVHPAVLIRRLEATADVRPGAFL
jgi:hypothetical protein